MIMKTMAAGEGVCISVSTQPRVQGGMGMEHQAHLPGGQMSTGTGSTRANPAPDGSAALGHGIWHLWVLCPTSTLCNRAEPQEH